MTLRRACFVLLVVGGGCHRAEDAPAHARRRLDELAGAALAWSHAQKTPPIFPMSSSAEWTPHGTACDHPGHVYPADGAWSSPPWSDLQFSIPVPTTYQYRVTRTGSGPRERFVIEARGDRDCNGVFSEFATAVDARGQREPTRAARENE